MVDRNDPVGNLKSQIENFENIQSEIQAQKTTEKSGCIVLDNTNIKTTLVDIMILWQTALLTAIQERACSEVNNLHTKFQTSAMSLGPTPLEHNGLNKNTDLLNTLTEEKHSIEAKLGPLEDKFKLLEEYSISMREDDIQKKNSLRDAWQEFVAMLERIQKRNERVSSELYYETMKSLEDFTKETGDNKYAFQIHAPFSSNGITTEKANSTLNEYRDLTKALRKREEKMRFGVDLFKISYAPSADLEYVEQGKKYCLTLK